MANPDERGPVAFAISAQGNWVQATRFANLLLRQDRRVLLVTDVPVATNGTGPPAGGAHPEGTRRPGGHGGPPLRVGGTFERGGIVVPLSPAHDPGLMAPVGAEEVRS